MLPNYNDLALDLNDPSPTSPLPPHDPCTPSNTRPPPEEEPDDFEEILAHGSLSFSVYVAYVRGVGAVMCLCVLVFLITMQVSSWYNDLSMTIIDRS